MRIGVRPPSSSARVLQLWVVFSCSEERENPERSAHLCTIPGDGQGTKHESNVPVLF